MTLIYKQNKFLTNIHLYKIEAKNVDFFESGIFVLPRKSIQVLTINVLCNIVEVERCFHEQTTIKTSNSIEGQCYSREYYCFEI